MPVPIIAEIFDSGLDKIPYAYTILKTIPWLAAIYLLKLYFGGATNRSERVLHSKVIMITVCFINVPNITHISNDKLITCREQHLA